MGLVGRVRLYKDALSPQRASWEEGLRQLAMSWVVNTILSIVIISNIYKEYPIFIRCSFGDVVNNILSKVIGNITLSIHGNVNVWGYN